MRKYWIGTVNETDDFGRIISDTFIDGEIRHGSWAIMTPASFHLYGIGLGQGLGQKYVKQDDGRFMKVEG